MDTPKGTVSKSTMRGRAVLRLTPQGALRFDAADDGAELDAAAAVRIAKAFERGSGFGLWRLGAADVGGNLPPLFAWWRDFAARYVSGLCHRPAEDDGSSPAAAQALEAPEAGELASLVLTTPPMPGAEYLSPVILRALWGEIGAAFAKEFVASDGDLQAFLARLDAAWAVVGRVHFNLAENRRDTEAPFAFMATYTARLSADAKPQHLPLGRALREYAGAADKGRLLSLLVPMQRAAEKCAWLKQLVDSGEIFHPLRWGPAEASRLLTSAGDLENSGLVLRMPVTWRAGRPPRPKMTARIGADKPSELGMAGLLDFRADMTLDGAPLDAAEIAALLEGTAPLVMLRGQWVEVDRERLESTMEQFRAAEELAQSDGLSFAEAMRLLAGASITGAGDETAATADWSQVVAGPWLAETLKALREPTSNGADPGTRLHATLRPYQQAGVEWLRLLSGLGLGACLADDMGLGKTIQVLSLLLLPQQPLPTSAQPAGPNLLVAPASLLANWMAEIEKFAPGLRAVIVHPSAMPREDLQAFSAERAARYDLVITSYGSLLRLPVLREIGWRLVVLDEAQAIKNPGAKQTKAVKGLPARARIALTGTPVENHLGDLWSIFDFLNPGLLGNAKQFKSYVKGLAEREHNPYGPLRDLVRPYVLRRMKTDKAIIADLPDKTEVRANCHLSRKQAALYEQAVGELDEALRDNEGIARKGVVLAMMMRLKQICNHPSQWLRDGGWDADDSGKFARLREIAETVASRQEKMLVFTQFRETTAPLARFLAQLFGRPGLVLHGETAVGKRKELVKTFQDDDGPPFFILSLKAGGSGLTLTAASHVVHFDRWWNPAVENQATDRAFRIGQKKNVLVHKFVCRGTIEERIDSLIESKQGLSNELLTGTTELNLTELSNEALLKMVALDLDSAIQE